MEANELMIGDWVKLNDYPIQVLGIEEGITVGRDNKPLFRLPADALSPIRLTKEFLEKNGVALEFGDCVFNSRLKLHYDKSLPIPEWEIRATDDRQGWYVGIGYCSTVHEFQHLWSRYNGKTMEWKV